MPRSTGRLNTPPIYNDPCVELLTFLSKASLIDCVVYLLREGSTKDKKSITESIARERLKSVLQARALKQWDNNWEQSKTRVYR